MKLARLFLCERTNVAQLSHVRALKMIFLVLRSIAGGGRAGNPFQALDLFIYFRNSEVMDALGTNLSMNLSTETSVLYGDQFCTYLVGPCFGMD